MKPYAVKEIFYSLQGEGHRKGSVNVFIRMAGCNMQCNVKEHGFDCDTDFRNGTLYTAEEIVEEAVILWDSAAGMKHRWCIITGGEPLVQLRHDLIDALHGSGFQIAVETNGTKPIPTGVDYVACCPKSVNRDDVVVRVVDELRYVVRTRESPWPWYDIKAEHYFLSPAFDAKTGEVVPGALKECVERTLRNPRWRLSVQDHKAWGLR